MTVVSDDKKNTKQVLGLLDQDEDDPSSIITVDDEPNDDNSNEISQDSITNDVNMLELKFPTNVMKQVIELVNKPRWVVPVLPGGDLETLLLHAIKFAYAKKDEEIPEFKDVYKSAFKVSFEKIMMDDAILNWKTDILDSIYRNALIGMKLIALKILDDNIVVMDVLSIILNPDARYHMYSSNCNMKLLTRVDKLENFLEVLRYCTPSPSTSPTDFEEIQENQELTQDIQQLELPPEDEFKYASHSPDQKRNRFIYVDLVNCFGHFGGFDNMKARVICIQKLSEPDLMKNLSFLVSLFSSLSNVIDFVTDYTITEFIKPMTEKVVELILNLPDDFVKPENVKEWKSEKLSTLIQYLERLLLKFPVINEDYINRLCVFQLNIILKVLRHASFNGKMNALNELHKLITTKYVNNQTNQDEPIKTWIQNNRVLSIVLKENLHQLQYVEKVEKLIRFMVQSDCLTDDDLDRLWEAQIGKHEVIVTNIHDLLAKLAYNFHSPQLQHLFECFQNSWVRASKRQRERLIDLIRRLAEEDKEGRMAETALNLLWDLATQSDSPVDIMESALRAHVKILDICCNQDRDKYRDDWLENLVNYLQNDLQNNQKNSVSTFRQIKEIIRLYHNGSAFNQTHSRKKCQDLEYKFKVLRLITNNLVDYLERFRSSQLDLEPGKNENNQNVIDEKFPHDIQIDERLEIIRFLLNEGQLPLELDLLTKIWNSLVLQIHVDNNNGNDNNHQTSGVTLDQQNQRHMIMMWERDQCFKWFGKLAYFNNSYFSRDDLDRFFNENFLKLDPKCLTINGIMLFEQIFRIVNTKNGCLNHLDCENYQVKNRELVGLEYLWRCAMMCTDEEVFYKILQMLKTIFTFLDPSISRNEVNVDFIQHCKEILQSAYDTQNCLLQGAQPVNQNDNKCVDDYYEVTKDMEEPVNKLANIIQILCEYIRECDYRYAQYRLNPALSRVVYGFRYTINVQYCNNFGRSNTQRYVEKVVHANELFMNVRQNIGQMLHDFERKDTYLEITRNNNEVIDDLDNFKTLEQLNIFEGTTLTARFVLKGSRIPSNYEPNEVEDNLPGVKISNNYQFMDLIIRIGDLSLTINNEKLRWSVNLLLDLLPSNKTYEQELINVIMNGNVEGLETLLHNQPPMVTIYRINILHALLFSCHTESSERSVDLLFHLLNNNSLKVFLKMLNFPTRKSRNVFVLKSCENSPIRLIALVRLIKIIYMLLYLLWKCINHSSHEEDRFLEFQAHVNLTLLPCEIIDEKFNRLKLHQKFQLIHQKNHLEISLPTRKDLESFIKLCWSCSLGNRIELMMNDMKTFHQDSLQPIGMTPGILNFQLVPPLFGSNPISSNNNSTSCNSSSFMLANYPSSYGSMARSSSYNNNNSLPTNEYHSLNSFYTGNNSTFFNSSNTCSGDIPVINNLSGNAGASGMIGPMNNPVNAMSNMASLPNCSVFHTTERMINKPTVCALECLSLLLACCRETNILELIKEKYTKEFITVLLLDSKTPYIREKGASEIRFILQYSKNSKAADYIIQMLFTKLHNVQENPVQYEVVFNLVVDLLGDLHSMSTQLSNTEVLLNAQLKKLLEIPSLPSYRSVKVKENYDALLIGRLRIVTQLFRFLTMQEKTKYNNSTNLVDTLLDSFLFPSSKRYSDIQEYQRQQSRYSITSVATSSSYMHVSGDSSKVNSSQNREFPQWATAPLHNPISNTKRSRKCTYDLLHVLVAGSPENMKKLLDKLNYFFHSDPRFFLTDWDFKPSFTSRSITGFVGLKNAGATCYMNSIIQQLFMIEPLRNFLMMVDAGPPNANISDYDDNNAYFLRKDISKKNDQKNNRIDILRELQMIFGNLAFSQNQFYTPHGFWRHFRLWGDEVNLREQHDALEFFTCLVDTLDEGLNSLSLPKVFEEVMQGAFADQKICKDCPHRYECEEKFFQLSVDIRNHENLIESLEQYVKGDLLEGDNAYFCETCKTKRDTIKRTCIKKLPLVLAIQLKRFDYDWEREIAVKFNDYFEFPNELDMEPYTVNGIIKREHLNSLNEMVRSPSNLSDDTTSEDTVNSSDISSSHSPTLSTKYTLKGVVVHGGQASGGHYYSYIRDNKPNSQSLQFHSKDMISSQTGGNSGGVLTRSGSAGNIVSAGCVNDAILPQSATTGNIQQQGSENGNVNAGANCNGGNMDDSMSCWYKFDDVEVTEVRMDAEEMKNQWFGGDFMGESYDHLVKRMSMRRQKRWWSAYILFYEREDFSGHLTLSDIEKQLLQTSDSIHHEQTHTTTSPTTPTAKDHTNEVTESIEALSLKKQTVKLDDITCFVDTKFTNQPMDNSHHNTFNITRLPRHIEETITLQNIEYMHNKSQYTAEYYSFLKELPLLVDPSSYYLPVKPDKRDNYPNFKEARENSKVYVVDIVSKFLFAIGFKTNKCVRGPADEWFHSLSYILRECERARLKFCSYGIFSPINKVTDFLLECPIAEVRETYYQFIRYIASWSLRDTTHPGYHYTEFQHDNKDIYIFIRDHYKTDCRLKLAHILLSIISVLLTKDISEHGMLANEYLHLFIEYPMMGYPELLHSLDVNMGTHALKYILDDFSSTSPTCNINITPLCMCFCRLMRCYDLSSTNTDLQIEMLVPGPFALSTNYPHRSPDIPNNQEVNPYCLHMEENGQDRCISKVRKIPEHLHRYIFNKTDKFVKKICEELYNEDTKRDFNKLIKFLCYNNVFSSLKILDYFSKDLVNAFIRDIKVFIEFYKAAIQIDDNVRLDRALFMMEELISGEHLDYVCKFKQTGPDILLNKRCYFIMKLIALALAQLTHDELKMIWGKVKNPKEIYDKFDKAFQNIRRALSMADSRRTFSDSKPVESNDDTSNTPNSIERTKSTEELERIGLELQSYYKSDDHALISEFGHHLPIDMYSDDMDNLDDDDNDDGDVEDDDEVLECDSQSTNSANNSASTNMSYYGNTTNNSNIYEKILNQATLENLQNEQILLQQLQTNSNSAEQPPPYDDLNRSYSNSAVITPVTDSTTANTSVSKYQVEVKARQDVEVDDQNISDISGDNNLLVTGTDNTTRPGL